MMGEKERWLVEDLKGVEKEEGKEQLGQNGLDTALQLLITI